MTAEKRTAGRTLRERRKAATRYDIALAAATLFEEQGFDATTVEQIADRAGLSLRTFYRYCSGKNDAVASELTAGPHELAAHITAQHDQPLHRAVHRGFVQTIDASGGSEDDRRKILGLILATPALRAAWLTAGRAAQDDLIEIIRARRPGLTPIAGRALAAATTAALTIALETWVATPGADLDEIAADALSILRSALDQE